MRHSLPNGWCLVSRLTVIACALVAALALARMLRLDPLPPAAVEPNDSPLAFAASLDEMPIAPPALSRDLFREGGQLPNALVSTPAPETVLPVSVVAIRLLGTVIRPSGSFALCQLPTDVPRLVHIGEKLGELTLISLEQGRAIFQAPKGARLELTLSTPRS